MVYAVQVDTKLPVGTSFHSYSLNNTKESTQAWVRDRALSFVCITELHFTEEIKQKKARGYFMACLSLEDGILRLGHCTKMKGKKNTENTTNNFVSFPSLRLHKDSLFSRGFMVTLREIKKSWFYVLPFNSLWFLNSKVVTNVKWVLEGRHFTTRQLSLVILHLHINTETLRPFPYWCLNCPFHSSFLM